MATEAKTGLNYLSPGALQPDLVVNAQMDWMASAILSALSIEFTADANLTLTSAQYTNSALTFTDSPATLTAGRDVVFPAYFPMMVVKNDTAQTLTLKKSGQAGVTVAASSSAVIASGVTDVVSVAGGGGGGGVSDGDKGDVTVSGSGATWTVDNNTITYAKMQDVSATSRILGRKTAGSGDPEECTLSEVLDMVGSAAQGDLLYRGASGWTRLGAGTSGQYLQTQGVGANPQWAAGGGGGGLTNWTEGVSTSAPNTTVPVVSFTATNAATDVDAALSPKGTGAVTAHTANNLSSGGNKRGANAVDWQTKRGVATAVASGAQSGVLSGEDNAASAQHSVVTGGSSNAASGQYARAHGFASTASGTASEAMGYSCAADGNYSQAGGHSANTNGMHRMRAWGSNSGAQIIDGVLSKTTTDATAGTTSTDGSTATRFFQLSLNNGQAYRVRGMVAARQTGGASGTVGDCKAWAFEGMVKQISGTFSIVGGSITPTSVAADAGASAWAVAVTMDSGNSCMKVAVTGEASKTIKWTVHIDALEC